MGAPLGKPGATSRSEYETCCIVKFGRDGFFFDGERLARRRTLTTYGDQPTIYREIAGVTTLDLSTTMTFLFPGTPREGMPFVPYSLAATVPLPRIGRGRGSGGS